MRSALWQLGFYDCYHMQTLIADPSRAPLWTRAIDAKYLNKGVFGKADWDLLLGDCQAVCDIPPAFFGAELAEAYPDAKVVILNRDPEAWYDSALESTYRVMQGQSLGLLLQMLFCAVFDWQMWNFMRFGVAVNKYALGFEHAKEKEKAIRWFKDQYAEFRDRIPKERRLEYSIKDGWGPLCEHLGVPVPTVKDSATGKVVEAPFPRLNDRHFFRERFKLLIGRKLGKATLGLFDVVGKVALSCAVGYFLLWSTGRLQLQHGIRS
jgi:hypothetical protein